MTATVTLPAGYVGTQPVTVTKSVTATLFASNLINPCTTTILNQDKIPDPPVALFVGE